MSTTEVLMPLMGEGITEATLVRWLKKPGDKVTKEEPLLEVSTDKVDTEIPAPAEGYLVQTLAEEGATVEINSVIAHIGESPDPNVKSSTTKVPTPAKVEATQEPAAAKGTVASPSTAAVTQAAPKVATRGPVRSSPLVRKIAREKNIDLSQVPGSGLGGRITKRDIHAFMERGPAAGTRPASLAAQTQAFEPKGLDTRVENGIELLEGVPVRREPMNRMRELIAEHMVRSVRTAPHVTTVFEIDLHKVVRIRETSKQEFQSREGFKLTFTPFFIHAAVEAIKRHPVVNVSVDGHDVLWKDQINIGCAVAVESGLIVPVIRNAGELSLLGIARRLNDLATRARSKKLTPDEVKGGTFSITNPGMFGSVVSTPIINQPQVAIMSIGAIIKRPVVIEDMIAVRPLVQIGLTFDHRVIDGEGGARYLATLKEILENYDDSPF